MGFQLVFIYLSIYLLIYLFIYLFFSSSSFFKQLINCFAQALVPTYFL